MVDDHGFLTDPDGTVVHLTDPDPADVLVVVDRRDQHLSFCLRIALRCGDEIKDRIKKRTQPVVEKSKYLEIKNATELMNALQSARELLLYSYFSSNLEIVDFGDNQIKYFDRQNDKSFTQKLALWLHDNTGKNWTLEIITEDPHQQTISERAKSEIAEDPMVASAMDLFQDAEIVNISK